MRFILQMAWRDSRASRRRLLLFSLSIALGVAALVALGSLATILAEAVQIQTKSLLGADLIVTSRAPFDPEVGAYLTALGGQQAPQVALSSMMVFPGAKDATRLVQVRAMAGGFPFYGDWVTQPRAAADQLRAAAALPKGASPAALVVILEDTLMRQFGLRPGDRVKLGRATFTVLGALQKMPGESFAVALLAPRALIPLPALAAAGLDDRRNLVSRRVALKLPPGADPEAIVREMREKFGRQRLSFDTVAARRRELGRTLTNVDGFLSLVGFIALLLGAIGVASAIHVYLRQKLTTVAVLRCLGARANQAFAIYLVQGFALGLAGALIGAGIGVLLQLALPPLLQGMLPFAVSFHLAWPAILRGIAAGVIICLLFTLLPLLAVRRISPLEALRAAASARPGRVDPWAVVLVGGIAAAVAGFAVWQTHSRRVGLGFAAGLAVCLAALALLARLTAWAARRWAPRGLPYVVRQGLANLHRPNNRTVLMLTSLGLGTFLVLTLVFIRLSLVREIEGAGAAGRPNLLFFDIQEDQVAQLDRLVATEGAPVLREAAIVTMKIVAVKGRAVEDVLRSSGDRIPAWTLRREYRSTFHSELTPTERVVAGHFVGRVAAGTAVVPISVEQSLVEDMRLKLGDEIDWDVQGVRVRSQIASIRAVEWRRLEPNFFVVFPAGVLEDAPKFYVAAVRAATPEASADLQRDVVLSFPNVTAIDLTLVLQTLDDIFGKVEFVLGFMALFTVATGLIVLAAAVLNGHYQRRRETALLRTLGASRRQLTQIRLVEHAVLGALAAAVGGALALASAGLLAHAFFRTPPVYAPAALLAAIAVVAGAATLTGWLAEGPAAARSPLEILREEG